MRTLSTLIILCCVSLFANGQNKVTHKLGLMLYNKVQKPEYARSTALKLLFVKGDPARIKSLVSQYKGIYKYSAGNISSVAIPYMNILAFSQDKSVERIEGTETKGFKFMDTARIVNNIDSAQQGIAPLLQAYTGTGVIVGIIDGGMYWHHQDFKRANGSTRVLYLWDQNLSTAPSPLSFGYGAEWDSTGLNNGSCNSNDPSSDQGHGTNVAGIAAGNGSSMNGTNLAGRYTGTAPDADMIVVNLNDTSSNFLQTVVDAANYIFTRASELGRPCVINTSVGTYYGSHDGQDMAAQAIDSMLAEQKARVLVAAAGNAGGLRFHLRYPLSPADSLFTWFTYNSTYQQVYYDMWADTSQFRLANFAIGCDSSNATYKTRTRYYNAVTDFNPAQGATVQIGPDTLWQGGRNLGVYYIAVTLSGTVYHVEFEIAPTYTTDLWRLQTLGQGTFDLWDNNAAIPGSSNIETTLPNGFTSPNYEFPDSFKTIVSSWQCSDQVITVANYSNRTAYLDLDTVYYPSGYVDGTLIPNSSIGPTRDGRTKPDISATGTVTTATGDSLYIALLIANAQGYKVSIGGKHTRNGGTSMASPIVCGCAALYLQEHPTASYSEVKQVLEATAKQDLYTTTVPNVAWGYGKVNCYRALLYPVVYGCMDTASFNYNPNANIDTGGCIPKIYGCTDTGSINYDSAANTDNGSCIAKVYGIMDTSCLYYNPHANVSSGNCIVKVYGIMDTACVNYDSLANVNSGTCQGVGIKAVNADISFDVIPNPFANSTTIVINSATPLPDASVVFYDVLGKMVDSVKIPANSNEVSYTNTKMAAGIYDAVIKSAGKVVASKKVVAE